MNEIEIFGSFSGLILNRNKTEGKLKNCKELIGGIKWAQNPVNALGIFFVVCPFSFGHCVVCSSSIYGF
jgi:hypothetical protein